MSTIKARLLPWLLLALPLAPAAAQTTINVKDAAGSTVAIEKPLPAGQATMANSRPVVIASNQSAVPVSDGGGSLTVDGTVAATQSGTWNIGSISTLPTLSTVTTVGTVTNLSQLGGAAIAMGTGTRSAGTQRVTIATDDVVPASQSGTWNITNISGTVSLPTGAATAANQGTLNGYVDGLEAALGTTGDSAWASGSGSAVALLKTIAGAALDTTTASPVKGGDAVDAALSANPVTAGCRASSAAPTAMSADGDVQAVRCDLNGNLVARMSPLANVVSGVITSAMTGTTSTSLVAAPGAGLKNYVTHIACYNTHASVSTLVNVQDGSGGTTIYQLYAPFGGGASLSLPFPLQQPTANTALYVADVTTGASVTCSASGFKAP